MGIRIFKVHWDKVREESLKFLYDESSMMFKMRAKVRFINIEEGREEVPIERVGLKLVTWSSVLHLQAKDKCKKLVLT